MPGEGACISSRYGRSCCWYVSPFSFSPARMMLVFARELERARIEAPVPCSTVFFSAVPLILDLGGVVHGGQQHRFHTMDRCRRSRTGAVDVIIADKGHFELARHLPGCPHPHRAPFFTTCLAHHALVTVVLLLHRTSCSSANAPPHPPKPLFYCRVLLFRGNNIPASRGWQWLNADTFSLGPCC